MRSCSRSDMQRASVPRNLGAETTPVRLSSGAGKAIPGRLQKSIEQPLEMIEIHVTDLDTSGLSRLVFGDRDRAAQRAGEPLFEIAYRGGLWRPAGRLPVLRLLGLL